MLSPLRGAQHLEHGCGPAIPTPGRCSRWKPLPKALVAADHPRSAISHGWRSIAAPGGRSATVPRISIAAAIARWLVISRCGIARRTIGRASIIIGAPVPVRAPVTVSRLFPILHIGQCIEVGSGCGRQLTKGRRRGRLGCEPHASDGHCGCKYECSEQGALLYKISVTN
jgi:hypothetical protein